jgi:hypothetical protein
MQDDMRVTWPALVSWAVDTRLLEPQNFTRCFFRSEVIPTNGGVSLLDWHLQNMGGPPAMDIGPQSGLLKVDAAKTNPMLFQQTRNDVAGQICGAGPNGAVLT